MCVSWLSKNKSILATIMTCFMNLSLLTFFLYQMAKRGLLERLEDGIVVGDGSFVFTLEKRGYVAAGHWTPEAAVLYPDAGDYSH